MADSFHNHVPTTTSSERPSSKLTLVASSSKSFSHKSLKQIPFFNSGKIKKVPINDVALFLLKVGALETVRRLSNHKCPFIWSTLQTLQVFCYPPLKWLQKWVPFRNLIKNMQMLSRPLLVISIATTFSNHSDQTNLDSDDNDNDNDTENSDESDDLNVQEPTQSSIDVQLQALGLPRHPSTNWLVDLYKELDNQGLHLPERINEGELYRFHFAANGDFSILVAMVKKSINWRKSYRILSQEELEAWGNMVFWHGTDVENRPCLIVRLVACIHLPPNERPRFAQAIVSQVEHGVLHLVTDENPEVTVLVDCEGLSLRFPMQLLRSCSLTLQENYPNRLSRLFIIRLPPVARVITQTFIQVLKPATKQKLKIIGQMYKTALEQHLHTVPRYLGGECGCCRCVKVGNVHLGVSEGVNVDSERSEGGFGERYEFGDVNEGCERVLRSAVVGVLMVWVLIALVAGIVDPESRPSFSV
ncbi:hypothetical protein LXL04_017765 [Taraxacum kok-saghyz]